MFTHVYTIISCLLTVCKPWCIFVYLCHRCRTETSLIMFSPRPSLYLTISLFVCFIPLISVHSLRLKKLNLRQVLCKRCVVFWVSEVKCLKYLWCILRMGAHSGRGVAYKLISRQTAALNQYCALNHFKTKTSFFPAQPCGNNAAFHTTASIKIRNRKQKSCFIKTFGNSGRIWHPANFLLKPVEKCVKKILGVSVKSKRVGGERFLQGTNKQPVLFVLNSWPK